ncbi:pro-sigmaK processing inhibitor BofA family protein [Paenibacillus sp. TRM 82003]|nr:pro-sigmaK processing inhibitor BofA family protein [Paenibacillus sp. TRM 82003]
MEDKVWLWLFVGSLVALAIVLLRSRIGWGWVGTLTVNLVLGGLLLYGAGLAEPYTHLHLPVNAVTVVTVAALGVPGLAMLAGIKLLIVA